MGNRQRNGLFKTITLFSERQSERRLKLLYPWRKGSDSLTTQIFFLSLSLVTIIIIIISLSNYNCVVSGCLIISSHFWRKTKWVIRRTIPQVRKMIFAFSERCSLFCKPKQSFLLTFSLACLPACLSLSHFSSTIYHSFQTTGFSACKCQLMLTVHLKQHGTTTTIYRSRQVAGGIQFCKSIICIVGYKVWGCGLYLFADCKFNSYSGSESDSDSNPYLDATFLPNWNSDSTRELRAPKNQAVELVFVNRNPPNRIVKSID